MNIPVAIALNIAPTKCFLELSLMNEGTNQLEIKKAQPTKNDTDMLFMFKS